MVRWVVPPRKGIIPTTTNRIIHREVGTIKINSVGVPELRLWIDRTSRIGAPYAVTDQRYFRVVFSTNCDPAVISKLREDRDRKRGVVWSCLGNVEVVVPRSRRCVENHWVVHVASDRTQKVLLVLTFEVKTVSRQTIEDAAFVDRHRLTGNGVLLWKGSERTGSKKLSIGCDGKQQR